LSGIACPACGLTRAAAAAARGDFAASLRFHPLLALLAIEVAVAFGLWARQLLFDRPVPRRAVSAVALATGALFLAVWVARLLAGSLPP
jgi:hypothetical protein